MDFRLGVLGVLFVSIFSAVFAAPWDFLRIPANWVDIADPVVTWILLLVSLCMLVIAVLAYGKKHSEKLAWVSVAFGLFFVKALLLVIDIYFSPGNFMNGAITSFFDLLIIGSIFIGLFRK